MLGRKKEKVIKGDALQNIWSVACGRNLLAQLSADSIRFEGHFLGFNDNYLVIENNLSHLDDVHRVRRQSLTLFFPFRNTLLKGVVKLMGLTTYQNQRALQFSWPEQLTVDEKRETRRIRYIPPDASLTFSTMDLEIHRGRILDVSLKGMGFMIQERIPNVSAILKENDLVQIDASLGALKLSFNAEIRYINDLSRSSKAGFHKVGVRMINIDDEALSALNQWIFAAGIKEKNRIDTQQDKPPASAKPVRAAKKSPNSILVIAPQEEDQVFWQQVLGRKYEVITSDLNISNIRFALSAGPALVLVYLDPQDASRASFTRKLCSSFMDNQAMMLFGEEPDQRRQQTLTGNLKSKGFLDTSERKVLLKFRKVDEIMNEISNSQ